MEFVGRDRETTLLRNWEKKPEGSFLSVIYGRRRIGKTRLVEEAFKDSTVLKFEGLEGQSAGAQQRQFLDRMAEISGRQEYRFVRGATWTDLGVAQE